MYGLLRAVVARRFLLPEVYDVMEDVGRQLVTSLRPNARSLCASVLLHFLLKYPMTDKRLQGHLDFFVRNLGYPLPEGRLAVLDMLHAVVTKFPVPVLDGFAEYLLLPLTVRLAGDADGGVRAAVGALIKALFRCASLRKAQGLTSLAVTWYQPGQKPGLRRVAAQVIGLAAEARPDALLSASAPPAAPAAAAEAADDASATSGSSSDVSTLPSALVAMTSELRRTASEAAAAAAKLAADAAEANEEDGDGDAVDGAEGGEGGEEGERRASAKADARAGRIATAAAAAASSGKGASQQQEAAVESLFAVAKKQQKGDDDDADSNADDNDEDTAVADAAKESAANDDDVPSFPVGSAGGGAEVFGAPTAGRKHKKEPSSSSSNAAASRSRLPALLWEPAYYTLLAAEKLWRHLPDRTEAAIAAAASASSAGSSGKRRRVGSDAEASHSSQTNGSTNNSSGGGLYDQLAPSASPADVVAAACDLLLFPHAWVRLAAARLLGAFLARRDLTSFAATPPPSPAGAASSSPSSASNACGAWLRDEATLHRLASRLASQLGGAHSGPALLEQAAKDALFVALALHASVPVSRRNKVHPLLALEEERQEGGASAAAAAADGEAAEGGDSDEDGSGSDDDDDDDDDGGSAEGGATAASSSAAAAAAKPSHDNEDASEEGEEEQRDPLYRLVDRLCHMAAQPPKPRRTDNSGSGNSSSNSGDASRSAILRLLAALVVKLPPNEARRYALPVVRLLYRVTSADDADASVSAGSRALASEALELLQERLGSAPVLRALNAERARVASKRFQRRKDRALAKIIDPAAAARAKEKRQRAKLRQKKRKVEAFRAAKGKRLAGHKRKGPPS